jgi:hypothetical protein
MSPLGKSGIQCLFSIDQFLIGCLADSELQPSDNFDPNSTEDLGLMFVRQRCLAEVPVWLEPRTERGKNDVRAEQALKKLGFPVEGWVVIFQPRDDPNSAIYVTAPPK